MSGREPMFWAALKTIIMITNPANGYWNEKKLKLKQKFPAITDEDLFYSEGKEKIMLEILSYKLGKTEQELLTIIVAL